MRALLNAAILIPASLAAQTWAPVGATWTYKQGQFGGPDTNLAVIEVTGDTIINGRACSKLTVSEGWFSCYEFVQFHSTSNDSLFYWDASLGEFHLLFRWDALPGQEWYSPVTQVGWPMDTIVWTATDTGHTVVDGITLRKVTVNTSSVHGYFHSTVSGNVYERIGNLISPFSWVLPFCDDETFQALRCYEDSTISWLNPLFPQCDLVVGLNEPAVSSLQLHPTLLSAGGAISITATGTSRLEILDFAGRAVDVIELVAGTTSRVMSLRGSFVLRSIQNGERRVIARVVVL